MPSRFILALLIAAFTNGCSYLKYPDIHKVTVQQGNIVKQDMVDKLRPGMTRSQVRYILGTPLLMDTFDQDRWDYYYSIKRPGRKERRRKITVFFDGNTLTHFSGDYLPSDVKPATTDEKVNVASDEAESTEATSDKAEGTEATSYEAESTEATSDEAESTEATSDEAESTEATSDEAESTEATSDEAESTEATSDKVKDSGVVEAQALPSPAKLEAKAPTSTQ